ncbi:hypothetical protein IQ250_30160 [Pseudanabaenaceae cyanobacterium LEGE 13415]|nr:hypothetical protein [Pseudanabaenaceae cyanobacterium LEGE 13415]
MPPTSISPYLRKIGILGDGLRFDQQFVRTKLSSGRYLFDYTNSSETEHYRQLLLKVAEKVDFDDLSEAAEKGYSALEHLEGSYAFFIGGVCSTRPALPFNASTPPFVMHYRTKKVCIEWDMDPNFLMSMSAISRMGRKNRYIVYCLVRTVEKGERGKPCQVTASPLLVAQPTKYVHKTPAIAYQKQYEAWVRNGSISI